jgi:hypothetical protein
MNRLMKLKKNRRVRNTTDPATWLKGLGVGHALLMLEDYHHSLRISPRTTTITGGAGWPVRWLSEAVACYHSGIAIPQSFI